LDRPDPETLSGAELDRYRSWTPFHERMHNVAIPTSQRLLGRFRADGLDVLFARIACLKLDERDRSLSQRKSGWNDLLLPRDEHAPQIPDAIKPLADEIVVTKTTDSALTGTNPRLILTNLGITHVVCTSIFTDQCISSTVRSLADESFDVIVIEDGCAAGSQELHERELEIINMIYASVMSADEFIRYLPRAKEAAA
jgi:nicotinamidase-related amidase